MLLDEVAGTPEAAESANLTAYVAPGNVRMVRLRRLGARPPRDLDDVHRLAVQQVTGGCGLAGVA